MNRPMLAALMFIVSILSAAELAPGQTGGNWNRRVEAIAAIPDAAGATELYAVVEVSADIAPANLATVVEFRVNGVTAGASFHQLDCNPCAGCDTAVCICEDVDGTPVCDCSPWRSVVGPILTTALQPGDEIMVILYPSPGALPDTDTSDDQLARLFDGDPIFWNRRIADVELTPSPGAPDSFFDIWIDVDYEGEYEGTLNMGVEVELLVNGESHSTIPAFNDWITWATCVGGCGGACAWDNDGLVSGYCEPKTQDWCPCYVLGAQTLTILNVPVDPGDELTVILRPAPGALPELPGFEEDDEHDTTHGCPEDLDGDGFVNVTDLLLVLASWGTPLADVTGDDNTDVADLLAILAKWGACFPV